MMDLHEECLHQLGHMPPAFHKSLTCIVENDHDTWSAIRQSNEIVQPANKPQLVCMVWRVISFQLKANLAQDLPGTLLEFRAVDIGYAEAILAHASYEFRKLF